MNLEHASHYVQIISGVVLVIGVGLVVLELQQTRRLAEAQLESESWDGVINRVIAQMGEDVPSTLAKACTGQKITERDAVVLVSRFQIALNHIARSRLVESLAGFEGERWKQRAFGSFSIVFASEHGRRWWDSQRSFYKTLDPEMTAFGDNLLERLGPPDCGLESVMGDA